MTTRVKVNLNGIRAKVKRAVQASQESVAIKVAKDSNEFVPVKYGALRESVFSSSNFSKGSVIWNTEYAKKLYWNPQYHFSHSVNPKARGMWFEAARAQYLKSWTSFAQQQIKSKL
ncbi:minor capsid protein [Loigolactobacillus coryniformis]|uniref:minor capsid protein n=1 Tax=Loigolactobacillus coryniformis TaxID=1610 RepID=UPI003F25C5A0